MAVIKKSCEDCGFFHDCPIDYECPALETLNAIRNKEGMIFTVHRGAIIGIATPMEEDEEE